jgi:hypothetical protein
LSADEDDEDDGVFDPSWGYFLFPTTQEMTTTPRSGHCNI